MGLRAAGIPEARGDGGDDTCQNGEAAEAELGVLFVLWILNHGVQGEVGGSGNRAQNDDGEGEGHVLGVVDAFGLFVHPAVTDGLVGPVGQHHFDFPGPAVLEFLLGGASGRTGSFAPRGCGSDGCTVFGRCWIQHRCLCFERGIFRGTR